MERAEAFEELAKITKQIDALQESLETAQKREQELYGFLGLPHPESSKTPRKQRISSEKADAVRESIISVARQLRKKGLTWLPMQLIVRTVQQEVTDASEQEIESQVRALSRIESSHIQHNGQRGQGSRYTYMESDGPT